MADLHPDAFRLATSVLEQALAGKGRPQALPLLDPDGTRVRLDTGSGSCIHFRFQEWSGEESVVRSGRRVAALNRIPTVWVLRRASSRLRGKLRDSGVSFIDLSGAVHLDLPGLIVDRTDLEPVRGPQRGQRAIDPFADRASRISRVLLSHAAAREWGVRELAEAARVNPSTASRVVKALAKEELVQFERRGRSSATWVPEPKALLQLWTRAYDWGQNERLAFNAPIGAPEKFLPRLKRVLPGSGWALSLHAGAWLIAPHATWNRVHLYYAGTEGELREVTKGAGWRPSEEGNLVVMFPFYKDSVWWRVERRQALPVVSVLQLVLDLWHYPLRGREQAEHLLESQLESVWRG
jgi:DNA-binding transcriptional ArsR family regulator